MKNREEIENKIKEYNEQLELVNRCGDIKIKRAVNLLRAVQIELLEWVLSD